MHIYILHIIIFEFIIFNVYYIYIDYIAHWYKNTPITFHKSGLELRKILHTISMAEGSKPLKKTAIFLIIIHKEVTGISDLKFKIICKLNS